MSKLFKFTPTKLNNIPPHDRHSKSTNNEVSDTEVQGLKLLIGKSGKKRFLLRFISPISKINPVLHSVSGQISTYPPFATKLAS